MKGSNNKRTRLEPRLLCNDGAEEVGQYYIQAWDLGTQTISHAEERVITVSLTLTRDFFRELFILNYTQTYLMASRNCFGRGNLND